MSALPLVTIAKDGSFELLPSTVNQLAKLKGPVAVIAIAGLYRTGKSYLLNRLLGKQAGFKVGPTVQPCTKGIYVWGDPPKINGVNVILLDTEGLGSTQQDQSYDTKIFSLALLLSSYFIYNSMGTIDERALEGLHLVTNLTKHISTKADQPMSAFMPNFIWCLRDFSLKLENEHGQELTESQYLESCLNFTAPLKQDKRANEKNAIRECIKTFFPRRDCACLVRPTNEESELQNIDNISESKLRPQFLKQMNTLTQKILNGVQPKKIMNQPVTGERFVLLLKNYVEAFNNGLAPEILGTWKSIAILENQKIVKTELSQYEQELSKVMKNKPLDDASLLNANNSLKLAAINSIQKNGLGEDISELVKEFEKSSAEIYHKAEKENLKASNEANAKFLEDLYKNLILQKLNQNEFANINKLSFAWNDLESQYLNAAKGPQASRLHVLNQFLGTKKNESFSLYSEHVAKLNQAEIENLKKISSEMKKNAKEAEKKLNDSLQLVSSQKHQLELNHTKASEELRNLKERYQDALNKIKEIEKKSEEQSQDLKNAIKKYEARIDELNEKNKELSVKERKAESNHEEMKEKFRKSEIEIDSLKKENRQLRENEKLNQNNDIGFKNTIKKNQSEIEQLEKELQTLKESEKRNNKVKETLTERERELESLRREIKTLHENEKRNEGSNQEWKDSLKRKDSTIESLEKEVRSLKSSEKDREIELRNLNNEKSSLSNKLSNYESDNKDLLEAKERQISHLEKQLFEENKQIRGKNDENTQLRLTNQRLTAQINELENVRLQHQQQVQQQQLQLQQLQLQQIQQQQIQIQSPVVHNNKKVISNTPSEKGFNFQPFVLDDNEMEEEAPRTSNNRFEKLNQPVASSPSKKRKQQAQLVVEEEEEQEQEPVQKKQKKFVEDFSKMTVPDLRRRIKDIDHTKLPMSQLAKPKLIAILESLSNK